MKTVAEKSNTQHQSKPVATTVSPPKRVDQESSGFADHRKASLSQTGLQAMVDTGPRVVAQRQRIASIFGGPIQTKKNTTGLPDHLKTGIESLSGIDISDVRVHRDSSKPAQLNALAYTQGNDIYLGPGQERHLPHEAWHAVQQKQGRVKPTGTISGMPLNDSQALEKEADMMGADSLQKRRADDQNQDLKTIGSSQFGAVRQFVTWYWDNDHWITFEETDQDLPTHEGKYYYEEFDDEAETVEDDVVMTLEYGQSHGDYHFTGKVTKKKAQWTIDKSEALEIMEAEIIKHLETLLEGSSDNGWTPWYIGRDTGEVIGKTVKGKETKFCIQLQVNKELGTISYHGYPDQRLLKEGVGKSKSTIG